ncbi:Por secretion system C-terminal sorting domain-containing protein [Aquiflexum balticum DSM 16537]|uniref:Por secretion system C-terminal sorting domain-containing protein n=1 Tax=Aquiflexum balticum DSM 16537 TaxID=758820 RepID=A0A1W2H2E9_9BACT|nr:cellulase family glycosylhydrolase [Aquiflexum balticum]SMD42944.1 Por secretion system C-terminal sorting domain-containing protein [Aquiflexum balticum DSM 16537]
MKWLIFLVVFLPLYTLGQTDVFELNQKLGRGMNMGNMFEAPTEGEWGNPFRNDYFQQIKELGFDHVRIPIRWDTPARTQMTPPYTINPVFFARIKEVVDLAIEQDLLVIINMHHHDALFQNPAQNRERFLAQWIQIAEFFKDYPEVLLFEVMNEPHNQLTPELWNQYFAEALVEIRKTNPNRAVMMGTALFGGVAGIFQLDPPEDDNIIVTVHFYNPFTFTHQGAEWVGDQSQNWLGTEWLDLQFEREAIEQEIAPLISFSSERNIPINMGEFGAYSRADMESRVRWTTFVARYLESIGFSWAYWEWSAGFGIFNPQNNQYIQPLVDALLHNEMPEPREAHLVTIYESNFENSNDSWNIFTQQNGQAGLSRSQGILQAAVSRLGTENWHVQLVRSNLSLENGKMYRFSFEAKSEPNISLVSYIGKASSPFNSYSGFQTTRLTDEYLEYSTVFKMSDPSDPNARIVFDMGIELGNTFFRKVKVQELDLVILSVREENPVKPKIYPNPVNDLLTIDLLNPGAQIELYNTMGQKIDSFLINGNHQKVEMGQLPSGVYILRIKSSNQVWEHFRVVKD